MIQSKIIPNIKTVRHLYKPKNLGDTENICLSCTLEECNPNVCKRYEAEKAKLLKALKRKREG